MTMTNSVDMTSLSGSSGLFSGTSIDMRRKALYYDFAVNAIDATKFTSSTAVNGTNTQLTTNGGSMKSAITNASAGDNAYVLGTCSLTTGDAATIIIEVDVLVTSATGQYVSVGLAPNSTNPAGIVANSIGYGFFLNGTNSNFQFSTVNNGGTQEIDTGLTNIDDGNWHRIRFEITGTGTAVQCFVDGTQVGTTHSTSLPTTSTAIYFQQCAVDTASGTGASNITIRSMRIVLIPTQA